MATSLYLYPFYGVPLNPQMVLPTQVMRVAILINNGTGNDAVINPLDVESVAGSMFIVPSFSSLLLKWREYGWLLETEWYLSNSINGSLNVTEIVND